MEKKYALSCTYKKTTIFEYQSSFGQYVSFYFAYIDEYGDAGSLLTVPTQPLFMLTAAFVPVEKWVSLETAPCEILDEMRKIPGLESLERLHAVDLYQRKKPFRSSLTIPQSFEWFEKILSVIHDHGVKFILDAIFKDNFHKMIQNQVKKEKSNSLKSSVLEKIADSGNLGFPVHLLKFFESMLSIDAYLIKENSFSTLVLDQHTNFNHYGNSKVYSEIRRLGVATRVLENPVFADSRVRPLLAVPDFLSYVFGAVAMIGRGDRERPKFVEWHKKFVNPLMIRNSPKGLETISADLVESVVTEAFLKLYSELEH